VSRVVSGVTGNTLMCCWNDCTRPGDTQYEIRVTESEARIVHYVFCSKRHAAYWANSHRDMGNLPGGSKMLGGPVQGATLKH
jgi:hypothetical protein